MIGLTSSFKMMVVSQRCAHMYFLCMHLVRAASYLHASLFVAHATYYNRVLVTNIIPSSNHTSWRRLGVHSTDCSYQFRVSGNLFLSCSQVLAMISSVDAHLSCSLLLVADFDKRCHIHVICSSQLFVYARRIRFSLNPWCNQRMSKCKSLQFSEQTTAASIYIIICQNSCCT